MEGTEMKNIGLIIVLCFLALVFPASGATVTIGEYTVAADGSLVAQMKASDVTNLGSVTVNLTFNPAVVQIASVDAGTGNALTLGLISNIDNSNGFAVISIGSLTGLSGDVVIANFALNAVGKEGTSSPLNIAIYSFADASINGYNIPVTPINGKFTITSSGIPGNSGGNGGSSGGGGGGGSGEEASNIEVIEKYDMQISKDAFTSYRFTSEKNPIMFVNITGNTSLGIITASIEVLKNTSTLLIVPPEGLVYKNANIWVGTAGYATTKNIKEAYIKFKVDNSWMSANGVSDSDIVLVKWDGNSWIQLETAQTTKDDTFTYYEAKTNAFSPFAISAIKGRVEAAPTSTPAGVVTETPVMPTGTVTPSPTNKVPGFEFVFTVSLISVAYLLGRKRR